MTTAVGGDVQVIISRETACRISFLHLLIFLVRSRLWHGIELSALYCKACQYTHWNYGLLLMEDH